MQRKTKNIIAAVTLTGLLALTGTTMYLAKTNTSTTQMGGGPSSGQFQPNTNNQQSDHSSNSNSQSSDTTGNTNNSSNSNNNTNSNNAQPPNGGQQGTPPSMGNSSSNNSMPRQMGEMPLSTGYYIAFGAESLGISLVIIYLIISKGNKKTFKEVMENKDRIVAGALAAILVTGCLTFGESYVTKHYLISRQTGSPIANNTTSTATGATTITSTKSVNNATSTKSDESAVLVKNGGKATITGKMTKSGDASSTESSEFNGVNAAVLVQKNGTATIKNATIKTTGKASNAVFATGTSSKITISDSTITTTGSSGGRGLDATYGGTIIGHNLKVTTQGASSASLATDRGEGTVSVSNSTLETNGKGSPVIYSTGKITLTNSKGTANGSQNVVVEGKNSATITNSTLSASGVGNRNNVDNAGVMLYQSMSGDAGHGTATFTSTNSTLSIQSTSSVYKSAPMFFITNTSAVVNLKNTKLNFGSGILMSIKGTSEWGTSGSNGGTVTINANNQTLTGAITLDKLSTLTLNLKNGSTYTGKINTNQKAKSVKIVLDASSKITLTGDTYVSNLEDADSTYSNINFNGYKLYVNGKAINA